MRGGHVEHTRGGEGFGRGKRKVLTGVSWGETEGKRALGKPRRRC
jgi:hypothetical protein